MSKKINKNKSQKVNNTIDFYSGRMAPVVLALVAALLYIASAAYDYTGFDDKDIILNNYEALSNTGNLGETFSRDAFMSKDGKEFYRPVQSLTFMFDAQISGRKATEYHITNVVLHAGTVTAIFYLVCLFGFAKREAFFAALIFAVGPLFSHTVSWIPSRGDLLSGFFGTMAFIWFIKFIREKKWEDLLIHGVFIFLVFFSKESGLILPFLFLMWYYFIEKKKKIEIQAWIAGAVWAIIGVFFLTARSLVVKTHLSSNQFGINTFIYNLRALPEYFGKFFIPVNLAGMPQYSWISTGIGIIALIVIIIFISAHKEKRNLMITGLIWFFITMIPQLLYRHIMGNYAYDYLEHRAYFPAIGLTILAAAIFYLIEKKYNFNSAKNTFLIITVLFAFLAFANSRRYADGYAFYNSEIQKNPDKNPMLYNNRGLLERESGRIQDAIDDYKAAIKIYPDFDLAYNNLGVAEAGINDNVSAAADYKKAITINPNYREAWNNLGIVSLAVGDTADAINAYEKAIKIDPQYYISWNNLGIIYSNKSDYQKAISLYTKAIKVEPAFGAAYFNRGRAYAAMGNIDAAQSDFNNASRLDPSLSSRAGDELNAVKYKLQHKMDNPEAIKLINEAIQRINAGDNETALKLLNQAAILAPNSSEVFNDRANLRNIMGDKKGACEDWKSALSLGFTGAQDMIDKYCK